MKILYVENHAIFADLVTRGFLAEHEVTTLVSRPPTLEELFLREYGDALDDGHRRSSSSKGNVHRRSAPPSVTRYMSSIVDENDFLAAQCVAPVICHDLMVVLRQHVVNYSPMIRFLPI